MPQAILGVDWEEAKDKGWMDVFVVIQKGELNMFIFGQSDHTNHTVVGGGNWLVSVVDDPDLRRSLNVFQSCRKMRLLLGP
jgi:hypothetical protein